MSEIARCRIVIAGLVVLAAAVFGMSINWGLPSKGVDPYLFGQGPVLSGKQIDQLAGNWEDDPNRPADVARNPILDRSRPVTLLDPSQSTPEQDINRARIALRYRLYSNQPDEMITFRALAMMHPGKLQFDPKLYQYGGLWIYPIGAIIKVASLFRFVTVTNDRAIYLDSPQQFGRFYILARAYSAAWGIVGMLAVFALTRKAVGGVLLPTMAAICFTALPVVLAMAHEAKPHLAGAAILLLSVLAAWKYVETGTWKWIAWTAIACGAAAGTVLSGSIGLVLLPTMALVRRDKLGRGVMICIAGLAIAAAVYFVTNPYVAIHLLFADGREVLKASLANTQAMYSAGSSRSGILNATRLVAVGTAWPIAVVGVLSAAALLLSKRSETGRRGTGLLLVVLTIVNLIQFAIFAAGKPGEYARFAIVADITLMLATFLAIARFVRNKSLQTSLGIAVILIAGVYSVGYERAFLNDDSRARTAEAINQKLNQFGILYVSAEPAPYCLPPVDLNRWEIVLLPRDGQLPQDSPPGVFVKPDDSLDVLRMTTPITWADKSFQVSDFLKGTP